MIVSTWRALAIVCAVMLARAPAHADSPWAEGVTDDQKLRAKALLDAGNALLIEKKYVEALEKYTAAVAVWDHPAIRFNMVRCEIQLGKNLEAYEDLEKSLRYGAAPLEETVYNEAVGYQRSASSRSAASSRVFSSRSTASRSPRAPRRHRCACSQVRTRSSARRRAS
jgi:tetratricopeptide (TPR) repeat protein